MLSLHIISLVSNIEYTLYSHVRSHLFFLFRKGEKNQKKSIEELRHIFSFAPKESDFPNINLKEILGRSSLRFHPAIRHLLVHVP